MTVKAWIPRKVAGGYVGLDEMRVGWINIVELDIMHAEKYVAITEQNTLTCGKPETVYISYDMLDLIIEAKNNLIKAKENDEKIKEANNGEVWG